MMKRMFLVTVRRRVRTRVGTRTGTRIRVVRSLRQLLQDENAFAQFVEMEFFIL
jgi:hypothetical protein